MYGIDVAPTLLTWCKLLGLASGIDGSKNPSTAMDKTQVFSAWRGSGFRQIYTKSTDNASRNPPRGRCNIAAGAANSCPWRASKAFRRGLGSNSTE